MKSSTSRTVPSCSLTSEQSWCVTPPGLSMNTRTTGRLSGPATSAWTSSTPWSMAACSASWRTRSFTDLESMTVPQVGNLRSCRHQLSPKRKSGRKPTGQRIRRPEQGVGLYEKDCGEASERQMGSCPDLGHNIIHTTHPRSVTMSLLMEQSYVD